MFDQRGLSFTLALYSLLVIKSFVLLQTNKQQRHIVQLSTSESKSSDEITEFSSQPNKVNYLPPLSNNRYELDQEEAYSAREQNDNFFEIPDNIPNLSDIMQKHNLHTSLIDSSKENERSRIAKESSVPIQNEGQWKANIAMSCATQKKIRKLMTEYNYSTSHYNQNIDDIKSEISRSIEILNIILTANPSQCNEVNVVYAINSCAKIIDSIKMSSYITKTEIKMKSLSLIGKVNEIMYVLDALISKNQLNARQLANSSWALARLKTSPIFSNLQNSHFKDAANMAVETEKSFDSLLSKISTNLSKQITNNNLKSMELCMVSWAYAVLNPRDCPAGWQFPPQQARLPTYSGSKPNDEICYEIGSDYYFNVNNNKDEKGSEKDSNVMSLFDSIASVLVSKNENKAETNEEDNNLPPILKQCSWKELSIIAWSFAHVGYDTSKKPRMIDNLTKITTSRLKYSSDKKSSSETFPLPRDISLLAWSLAVLNTDSSSSLSILSDDYYEAFIDELTNVYYFDHAKNKNSRNNTRPLRKWNNADLVQLANALARAHIDNTALLPAIYKEALLRLTAEEGNKITQDKKEDYQTFLSLELSALIWVQAKLYLTSTTTKQGILFKQFSAKVTKILITRYKEQQQANSGKESTSLESIGIKSQEQANLAWSLTVLEDYSNESIKLIQYIFEEAACQENKSIQIEHAHQLWQAFTILQEDCPEAVQYVSRQFELFLQEKWQLEKTRQKTSSARHKTLSKTLNLMGVSHYMEHDEDIDVAIILKDASLWTHTAESSSKDSTASSEREDSSRIHYKVAVEFDGPSHFTKGSNPRALGHTVLKYRLLRKKGWTVVRVPYYEFDKIPFWASMERQRYIQRLLKTHKFIRFSDKDFSEYVAIVNNRQSRYD